MDRENNYFQHLICLQFFYNSILLKVVCFYFSLLLTTVNELVQKVKERSGQKRGKVTPKAQVIINNNNMSNIVALSASLTTNKEEVIATRRSNNSYKRLIMMEAKHKVLKKNSGECFFFFTSSCCKLWPKIKTNKQTKEPTSSSFPPQKKTSLKMPFRVV